MSETYAPSGTVSATSVSRFTAAEAATGTFGTMDRATITELLDRTRYLDQTGQLRSALKAFIGDDANASNTLGLTINQAGNDDEILSLKSSDVAHGVTTAAETDTFATFSKAVAAEGGLRIRGLNDTGTEAFVAQAIAPVDVTTKATTSTAYVEFLAQKINGTAVQDCGANANLLAIVNNTTTRFLFDAEGDAHADVSWTTF